MKKKAAHIGAGEHPADARRCRAMTTALSLRAERSHHCHSREVGKPGRLVFAETSV